MIGNRIGPYEVTAKLGEGGMGEVWRATDSHLGRDVALKMLPEEFTADAERLARFEREAKVLAQLNHPGIAQIYGLETSEGGRALVMELVEGPTLGERLEQGPMPIEECLTVALKIAEALEEAHKKGIVHRDLKPHNVKLVSDGGGETRVKVLDFGLAKPSGGGSASDSARLAQSPTLTAGMTEAGVILGTAAYMAPEQAASGGVDHRADIWAFGVVLWEMLAGQRLFEGETVSHVLAAVLKDTPDFSLLRPGTPQPIERLLRRCLRKKPRERLQAIGDARIVIEEVLAGDDGTATAEAAAAPPARRLAASPPLLVGLAGAIALGVVLGYFVRRPETPPPRPMRLSIQLGMNQQLTGLNSVLAFTPDGGSLLFTGSQEGQLKLFRRDLGADRAEPIEGTENGENAFLSPDGRWVGFVAGNRMLKVPLEGGRPLPLVDAQGAGGATWLSNGTIVYNPVYTDGLFRISVDGTTKERLTTPDREDGVLGHWTPWPLPGERHILFTAFRTPVNESKVGVVDLETLEVKWILSGGFYPRYVDTGHLLFAREQRLFAQPFDPASLETTGPAVVVLDDLWTSQTGGYARMAVSRDGTLAYVTQSRGDPPRELVWLDRAGTANPISVDRLRFVSAALSPDGRQAAVTIQGESRDLWTYSFARSTLSRLTTGTGTEMDPIWSRRGDELFFIFDRPPYELHRIAVGEPDSGRPIWEETTEFDYINHTVSPDDAHLAFALNKGVGGSDLYFRPLDGSAQATAFRATRAEEMNPSFSPDGRWLAYESDETGRPEIYVEAFPSGGQRMQVSAEGGSAPVWAANGEIFFRRGDEIWAAATRHSDRFELDPPKYLFSYPTVPGLSTQSRTYDVTSDGGRLLAITIPQEHLPRQIEVVTHWTSTLE